MSGAPDEAGAPDWALLRHDYETGAATATAIAARAGMNRQQLVARARREGWSPPPGTAARAGTRETIRRLKALLQQRLGELEAQIGSLGAEASAASSERDIRAMNTLVRTLEKVLELERKDRARRHKRSRERRRFDDAEREALAQRLEALNRAAADQADDPADVEPGGVGVQP